MSGDAQNVDDKDGVFEIFETLCELFKVGKYENELEAARKLQLMPAEAAQLCRQIILDWLNAKSSSMEERERGRYDSALSFKNRGNEFYQSQVKENRFYSESDLDIHGWLGIARLYSWAIMEAPPKSELLAMSHANRAMALMKCGYYKQAYEDCGCALETGSYPENLRYKVWLRQANCAWHLGAASRLGAHLEDLADPKISASCSKEVEELRRKHQILMQSGKNMESDEVEQEDVDLHRDSQKIVEKVVFGQKVRSMVATRAIKKGELIFTERVSSFVPIKGKGMCQECGVTHFIPFPCSACYGSAAYCSVKCRNKHQRIHRYECVAYQKGVLDRIGIGHLALRVMLDGLMLSNILPHLRQFGSAQKIWSQLVEGGGGLRKHAPAYAESLRMVTNLHKMPEKDIKVYTLLAFLLTTYLKEFTTFYVQMEGAAANASEWELVTTALLLRHIAQLTCNAHTSVSLMSFHSPDNAKCPLLMSPFWAEPFRLKRDCLGSFDNIESVAAMNLPYFSICNHSCEQYVQPKYNGRYVQVYACRAIEANKEIFNTYTLDCRKSKWTQRSAALKNNYKFYCKCERCAHAHRDKQYDQFHKYWCEKCRKYFAPQSNLRETHNWWQPGFGHLGKVKGLKCCYCGDLHSLDWAHEVFENLQKDQSVFKNRKALYNSFCLVETKVCYYHTLRLHFAAGITKKWHNEHRAERLLPDEYPRLVHLLKLCLDGIVEQGQKNSIEYAAQMTWLWDLIGAKKYKCDKLEMATLLAPLEAISDENKLVFMNYYDDYIKPVLE